MLETIREFALERLADSGEQAELRRRHATHFLRLAEDANREHFAEVLPHVSAEYENLRSALEWARDQGEDEILLRLVAAVGVFWDWHGFARELRSWVAIARERGASPRHARMKVLRLATTQALDDRAIDRAKALIAEYSHAAEQEGDEHELLLAKNLSAHLARLTGDWEGARAGYVDLRQLAHKVGDREVEAFATINLGGVETNLGDLRAGLRHSTEAAELFRKLGRETGLAAALSNCGWNAIGLEQWALAEDSFGQALAISTRLGAKPRIATEAVGLAAAFVAKRDEERAAQLLGAAAALRDELETEMNDAFEEQVHERAVADARTALGEATFAAAWARGERMTPEEMVAFLK